MKEQMMKLKVDAPAEAVNKENTDNKNSLENSISKKPSQVDSEKENVQLKSPELKSVNLAKEKESSDPDDERPIGKSGTSGMPSWADFMKEMENVPPEETKPVVIKKPALKKTTPTKKEVDPEEEEKKKLRKEQEEKRRQEMKEQMSKLKKEPTSNEKSNLKDSEVPESNKTPTKVIEQPKFIQERKEESSDPDDERPIGKSGTSGMPSWADFMKEMENVPPEETKPVVINKPALKKTTPTKKEVDPEEEEKKKLRKEQEEKRRKEMKEQLDKMKKPESTQEVSGAIESKVKTVEKEVSAINTKTTQIKASSPAPPSPQKDIISSTFNLIDLDQIINLDLRTTSDVPKYSRKDVLKIRYFVMEQAREEHKELIEKRNDLKKKVELGSKEIELQKATMQQHEEILNMLSPSLDELKKLHKQKIEKMKTLQDLTNVYEELKTSNELSLKTEATFHEKLSLLQRDQVVSQQRYNSLRSQAEKKLKDTNEELVRLKEVMDAQLCLNSAKFAIAETRSSGFKERITIQERENSLLMKLCEDMLLQLEKLQK